MRIEGIDFPKSLLDAIANNQLVVFAGAGVSIPDPAGLPSFCQLAEEIARGSGESRAQGETEDHFLGRLRDRRQEIHVQVARVLQEKDPQPSGLHNDITSLYRNPDCLRIVTTNFDTLFEQAANKRFGTCPEVFRAPALPVGSDFNGIVHVHGSIEKPKDMVLTDADFGRAYLTEGWARRFLVDLFRTYPVLFVGYGHNDTVMNYLARALPAEQTQPRFAFAHEAEMNNWNSLSVEPLVFPQLNPKDYSGLYQGIAGLAKNATRSVLGWQATITEIAANPPSLNQEDMELIGDAFHHPTRTRFFTEAASNVAWIRWLDEHGHLDNLFGAGPSPDMEETTANLAWWLARKFAKEESDELFRLIGRHEMDVNPTFWASLARAVGSPDDSREQPETLARWISLLLKTAPPTPDTHLLLFLGERCINAQVNDGLLDIFESMSATTIHVRERMNYSQDNLTPTTTIEINHVHPHWELNQLWENGLKPNLKHLAEPMLMQLASSFVARHRTLCTWGEATREWDPDSFRRSAIEPHEQDSYPQPIDVLIDAARDSLEFLSSEQHQAALSWFDQLVRSDAPLLRRLAVHTARKSPGLTASAKIDRVLNTVGLHDQSAHHELFKLMREVYPQANQQQRQTIMEEVSKFDLPEHDGEEFQRIVAHEHFTWFTWLSQSDPTCPLAKSHVEAIEEQYPEFKPREWAEFPHYHAGGMISHVSPWSTDELLSRPARKWVPELLSFQALEWPDTFGPRRHQWTNRQGLCSAVEEAANLNFSWGLELADSLAQKEAWDTDLWRALLRSWAHQRGEPEQNEVFDRLIQQELQKHNLRTVAETLATLVKEGNLTHKSGLLSKANQVTTKVWDNIDESEMVGAMWDWYSKAINHPAGMLTGFWMHSLSIWYNEQDPHLQGISQEYLEFMDKIVREDSTEGRMAKSVMAREIGFLTAVDEQWVREHLMPLFDSEKKDDRLAVWESSFYGALFPAVATNLEAPLLNALADMDELFPEGTKSRENFVRRFTTMVTRFVDSPLENWVPSFFAKANEEDRRQFALTIADNLRPLENDPQKELWDRWLREYWENRIIGKPAALHHSETRVMFFWLAHLHDLFPEAVELAVRTPNLPSDFSPSTHLLNNKGKAESHPEATAKLLIHLADQKLPRHAWLGAGQLFEKLLTQPLPEGMQYRLKEIQAEAGL